MAHRVERPRLDERFNRCPAARLRINAFAEIEEARERAILTASRRNRLRCTTAAAFDGAQAKENLAVGYGEIGFRAIHIGRHDHHIHPLAIFQVLDERILALEVAARDIARK